MFKLTHSLRIAMRASTPRPLSSSSKSMLQRSSAFHSTRQTLTDQSGGRSTATPSSDLSSSSQQPQPTSSNSPPPTASSPRKSASDPKETTQNETSEQDLKETERAMGGAENSYGQYGAAGIQEGNATAESELGKERKEAAKQGEK